MIQRMNKAMTKRRDAVMAGEKEQGFTLIELMVVIIIIGILAAIAIPVFLNQRQQAWTASVKSDLANASIAAESLAVSNNGSYTTIAYSVASDGTVTTTLPSFKASPGNTFSVVGTPTATTYTFQEFNTNNPTEIWQNVNGTVSLYKKP